MVAQRWRSLRAVAAFVSNYSSRHELFSPTTESKWILACLSSSQQRLIHSSILHHMRETDDRVERHMLGTGVVNLGAERGAISVQGENTLGFLQNLVTQDTSALSETKPSIYCHMLNSKGRFMYDVFLHRISADHVVVDVAQQRKDSLVKVLKMYSLRSSVRIKDESDRYTVMVVFGDSGKGFCEDARLGSILGYRGVSVGTLDSSEDTAIPVSDYTKLRISLGVAEGPEEIPEGSVPLEYNLDGLNGISFSKGCYIGQELMARTHYQGQIRKRIMPFEICGGEDISIGDDIVDVESKKKVGSVRSACVGGVGLALIRTASVLQDGTAFVKNVQIEASGASIQPYVPSWWPSSYLA